MVKIGIEAIIPSQRNTAKDYERVYRKALEKTIHLVEKDFKVTTRTWKTDVTFQTTIEETSTELAGEVSTDNLIYGFVSGGTKPHIIRPRRAGLLRFRGGYRAKTRVNVIKSYPGGAFGEFRSANFVLHPGNPARNFDKVIARRRQKTLAQEASHGIAKLARQS